MDPNTEPSCPVDNWCQLVDNNAPPCGDPKHVPPISPPGTLCPQALWEQYESLAVTVPETPFEAARLLLQQAGLMAELSAIPPPEVTETQADEYGTFAQHHLAELRIGNLRGLLYSEARLLTLYVADYRNNAKPYMRQESKVDDIRLLMGAVRRAPSHESAGPEHEVPDDNHLPCFPSDGAKKGAYTKLACLAVCELARVNILPATWRCNRVCDAFVNHKPTKFTSTTRPKDADPRLTVICLEDLIDEANQLPSGRSIIQATAKTLVRRISHYIELGGNQTGDHQDRHEKRADELIGRMAEHLAAQFSGSY